MTTAWLLKNLIGTLLLPPANSLLLLGLAGAFRKRRWAFWLACLAALLLLAQCLPVVSRALMAPLEQQAGGAFVSAQGARAIVVLGSGLRTDSLEYGGDTTTDRGLVRLRYGAILARRLELPVLITGGTPPRASLSEADVMAAILDQEFNVPVRWRETESRDTADNATMSALILKSAGIHRVVLVTQAFHMPRARRLFEAAGLEVVPAPTDFRSRRLLDRDPGPLDFLPSARALHDSYYALHEWLGIAWISISRPRASG